MKPYKELLNQLKRQHTDSHTTVNIEALEEIILSLEERLSKAQQETITFQQKATFLENEREVINHWRSLYDIQHKEVERLRALLSQADAKDAQDRERFRQCVDDFNSHVMKLGANLNNEPHKMIKPSSTASASRSPQRSRLSQPQATNHQPGQIQNHIPPRTPPPLASASSTVPVSSQKNKTPITPATPLNADRHTASEVKSESPELITELPSSLNKPSTARTNGKRMTASRDVDGEDSTNQKRPKVNKVGSADTPSRSLDENVTSASDDDKGASESDGTDELAIRSGDDGVPILSPLPGKKKKRRQFLEAVIPPSLS